MPKLAANLTLLFTELPFLDRFDAAARAGFKAVEVQFPYEYEVAQIASALAAAELDLVLHNLPAGDWSAGDRGLACDPARKAEFRAGVSTAIGYATALGCPLLNCLAGRRPPAVEPALARRTLIENLSFVVEELAATGIRLVLEHVNSKDVPGFFVDRPSLAIAVMDEVGSPDLKLQFDIYHAQVMEGDLSRALASLMPRIGHVQIADNPGRHEPGTGEINFRYLFRRLDELGYDGWVGCEYVPQGKTVAGLGWIASTLEVEGSKTTPSLSQAIAR